MVSGFIATGTQKLHYLRWDGGPRLLLAFHGYGNNAVLFRQIAEKTQSEFTTLSFDLPYHGKSTWQSRKPWRKQELIDMVKQLKQEFKVDRISIACFSIGGRVGLTLAELMPAEIEQLVLIASDGLVHNRFYGFVTKNNLGKKLFYHFLEKPEGYMKMVNWLAQNKFVDSSRKKFIEYYVGAPDARSFLKNVWPNLRLIVPDLKTVKLNIDQYRIKTHIFMGKLDRVIPLDHAYTFAKGVENVNVHELNKGHRIMDEETAAEVAKKLIAG